MSEVHLEEHSSPIKTPKQLIIVVVLAFLVPIVLIVMLTQLVTSSIDTTKENPALAEAAVAARLKPVGQIEVTDPNAPKVERSGKEVVDALCGACHMAGALNAPKIGDKSAWGKLLARGLPNLTQSAIKGVPAKAPGQGFTMPPRGGDPDVSDLELARAIAHMANQSGLNVKEPEAKPAVAAAPKK